MSPFGTVAWAEGAVSAFAAALSVAEVWLVAGVLAVLSALLVAVAVWPTGALLAGAAVLCVLEAEALFWSDCGMLEALLADWSAELVLEGVVAGAAEALWSEDELVLAVAAAAAFWSVVLGFAAEAELLAAGAALEEAALWSLELVLGVAAAALWSELGVEDWAVLLSHLSAIIFTSPETLKVLLSEPIVPFSCTWCPMCWSSFAVSPLSLYWVPFEFSV